jgi:hypothetical protein
VLCRATPGVSHSALTSSYVLAATDQQASIMVSCLGVQAPSAAQVYRSDVLPRLQALPQPVRDRAMLLMLRQLPDLQQQDRGFVQLLTQTAFLPSGSRQLHRPSQLYDPRSPELVALLDPDACFPAPAFCGDVSDTEQARQQGASDSGFSSLAMLQQLGLRSGAQLDTLVQAARYVEKLAASGDEDMAVARGKVRWQRLILGHTMCDPCCGHADTFIMVWGCHTSLTHNGIRVVACGHIRSTMCTSHCTLNRVSSAAGPACVPQHGG